MSKPQPIFQGVYENGGYTLFTFHHPEVLYEHGESTTIGRLGFQVPTTKVTTSVKLVSEEGKELTISGDIDLVLSTLEKLK